MIKLGLPQPSVQPFVGIGRIIKCKLIANVGQVWTLVGMTLWKCVVRVTRQTSSNFKGNFSTFHSILLCCVGDTFVRIEELHFLASVNEEFDHTEDFDRLKSLGFIQSDRIVL